MRVILFFFGDFIFCGRSSGISIRSSISDKVSYGLLIGTNCLFKTCRQRIRIVFLCFFLTYAYWGLVPQ